MLNIKEGKMPKKCLYCNAEIPDSSVVDFCNRCGYGVFGEKLFNAILKNMEGARDNGDLCHVSDVNDIEEQKSEPDLW